MARQPLSSVDVAWLQMEDPTNLMMVTGLLLFDRPVDAGRLRRVLEQRLLAFPRFRQRVVRPRLLGGLPHWEDDPLFLMEAHIHRVALPSPGGDVALQQLVSDLMGTPLDYSKPLWHVHLVEGYENGSAVLVRIHHCIGDGLALIHVMLSLTDTSARPARRTAAVGAGSERKPGAGSLPWDGLPRLAGLVAGLARNPGPALQMGMAGTSSLAGMTLLPPDPPNLFKGRLGVTKRAAWSRPEPLDQVKAIGRANSATVNDVLVAAATGALRRYLVRRGQPVTGLEIRASVPVNLRPPEDAHKLGNSFGLVFLSLPVGIGSARRRLNAVRRRMEEIKRSPDALMTFALLNAVGRLPSQVEGLMLRFFGSKATAVMTNVPGPARPIYLAGRRIGRVMFWVPLSGHLGLGISILSYAGEVMLGVATDAGLVPDPEAIVEGFHQEMAELARISSTN
jgi:diacylglycerol O-acyltransferase / wax synthase